MNAALLKDIKAKKPSGSQASRKTQNKSSGGTSVGGVTSGSRRNSKSNSVTTRVSTSGSKRRSKSNSVTTRGSVSGSKRSSNSNSVTKRSSVTGSRRSSNSNIVKPTCYKNIDDYIKTIQVEFGDDQLDSLESISKEKGFDITMRPLNQNEDEKTVYVCPLCVGTGFVSHDIKRKQMEIKAKASQLDHSRNPKSNTGVAPSVIKRRTEKVFGPLTKEEYTKHKRIQDEKEQEKKRIEDQKNLMESLFKRLDKMRKVVKPLTSTSRNRHK